MPVVDAALIADIRASIDAQFGPINPDLLTAEQNAIDAGRTKLATVIAEGTIYARGNNLVNVTVTGVQAGSDTADGTGAWS